MRALAGESTEQVEMVIRNDGQPQGIAITVSGRPLVDRAGRRGAVAVFHDITDRKAADARLAATIAKLREREADLQAFAGVVAHDLKAPLSVVAGYAELLDDDLDTLTDAVTLRPNLQRISVGVQRMRRLIDELLAYATARDGTLDAAPVDLQALCGEVVAERTAGMRAGVGIDGQPCPDIYIGPLPMVHADAVMTRQLLDNLVGNALKYTVPGQPARVDISARPDIDGRGTGIPATDQPHVFGSFHRSAAHTGYTGTGLGLAICKRIVDRHHGTIAVADNPGGDTRVHFTLPATTTSDQP